MLHPFSNIKITEYFSCKPKFNSGFSRNNLSRLKDGAYVINLNDNKSKGTNWVSLFIDRNTVIYFNSLELNIFLKKNFKKSKKNQLLTIYLEYKNESTICRFYYIAFIKYILAGKTLLDYTNLFSRNNYKKNDITIYVLKINMIERNKSRDLIKKNR